VEWNHALLPDIVPRLMASGKIYQPRDLHTAGVERARMLLLTTPDQNVIIWRSNERTKQSGVTSLLAQPSRIISKSSASRRGVGVAEFEAASTGPAEYSLAPGRGRRPQDRQADPHRALRAGRGGN
jgi:hypothetical protein